MPLLALGGLWVILWRGRARAAGLVPMVAAMAVWAGVQRPDLLVSASGGLVGVMTPEGRVLSKPRGDGFAAESWLENDGDAAEQEAAYARPGLGGEAGTLAFALGDLPVVHLSGRGAADRVETACAGGALVILTTASAPREGCTILDAARLAETGTVAVWATPEGPRMVTVRDWTGRRPWTGQ
jgi:competence protein ComEC